MTDDDFLRRAIEISAWAIGDPGLRPYGAVVIRDGVIVGEGINRSEALCDPTSHGETEAIRDACRGLGTTDLSGCTLYASCEPCPLCVAAMVIAGIGRLVYAVSLDESAVILSALPAADRRRGADVAVLRHAAGRPVGERRMPAAQRLSQEAQGILRRWCADQQAR